MEVVRRTFDGWKVRNIFYSTILFQRDSSAMLNGDPDNGKELTGPLTHFNKASKSKRSGRFFVLHIFM